MPAYATTNVAIALSAAQGIPATVWNGEALSQGNSSQQVALAPSASDSLVAFSAEVSCSTAPTTATFDLQISNTDADADYQTVSNVTIATPAKTGRIDNASGYNARFARLQLSALTGSVGNVTANINR